MAVATPGRQDHAAPQPRSRPSDVLPRALRGFTEVVWLYALVAVPITFSVVQTRNFELLKTLSFRMAMSLVVLVAIVDVFVLARPAERDTSEAGDEPRSARLRRAAVVAAVGVVASVALATAFSLVPRISLVGSHIRNFGLFSEAMHLVLFLALAWRMRSAGQAERAIDAVIGAGLVLGTYAVVSYAGFNPLEGAYATRGVPPTVTVGNPGFYGAFLVVSIALAIGRLAGIVTGSASAAAAAPAAGVGFRLGAIVLAWLVPFAAVLWLAPAQPSPWWFMPLVPLGGLALLLSGERLPAPSAWRRGHDVAVFGVAVALQLVCLWLTQSRAAWVAAAIAVAVLGLCLSRRRAVRLAVAALASVVLLGTVVVLVGTMQNSPISLPTTAPVLGSVLRGAGSRLSVEQRVAIWNDVAALVASGGAGAVSGDRTPWLRPLVGYGPGTLYMTAELFTSERRLRVESARIDRAHNELLDRLAGMGAFGLATWIGLSAVLLALGIRAVRRSRSAGVGWLAPTVAAALVGALVGDLFGPGDVTSRVLFWFLAGVIASPCLFVDRVEARPVAAPAPSNGASAREPRAGRGARVSAYQPRSPAVTAGAIVASVVGLIVVAAVVPPPREYAGFLFLSAVLTATGLFALSWWRTAHEGGVTALRALPGLSIQERIGLAVMGVFAVALTVSNLRPAEADLYNQAALLGSNAGAQPTALGFAQRAVRISPNEELYYMTMGGILGDIAPVMPDRPSVLPAGWTIDMILNTPLEELGGLSRADFLALSAGAFERARDLNPYDYVHYANLGQLAVRRAELGDPTGLEQAERYFQMGFALSPRSELLRQAYEYYLRR